MALEFDYSSMVCEPRAAGSYLTLSELCAQVRWAIQTELPEHVWVVAEVVSLQNRGSYVFLDLAERDEAHVSAQMRAKIWNMEALEEFEEAAGEGLRAGMRVLVRGEVRFHDLYGLSFNIDRIDASYTLGEIAAERQRTLDRLRREGLLDVNARLPLPIVPQRIAVISSRTAAGCQDFLHQLEDNRRGYAYRLAVFDALVQGEQAPASIIAALAQVEARARDFDLTVLVRGGGSNIDLSCFDSYALSAAIARHPLPVITGIGHLRDGSIADLASHTAVKTPTAAAEWIIARTEAFEVRLEELARRLAAAARGLAARRQAVLENAAARIQTAANERVRAESVRLEGCRQRARAEATRWCDRAANRLAQYQRRIAAESRRLLDLERERMAGLDRAVRMVHPQNTMRRGFSITWHDGQPVTDPAALPYGAVLQTVLSRGTVESRVVGTSASRPAVRPTKTARRANTRKETSHEKGDSQQLDLFAGDGGD